MWWRSIEVAAPADAAWDLLVDLDRWPDWGPTVRGAELDGGGRPLTAGATGHVRPVVGPAVPFAVTRWMAGEEWAWRVGRVPATAHRVERLGPGRCRVAMGAPVWAAAYLPVLEVGLRRIRTLATP